MSKNQNNPTNPLRLSPSTPLGALVRKAKIAAISAALRRDAYAKEKKAPKSDKHAQVREPMIERTIRTIELHLKKENGNTRQLVKERPARYTSVHTILCVYRIADIELYKANMAEWKASGRIGRKPSAPKAESRYMFFPSVIDPTQLGSVAISGANLEMHRYYIKRFGILFGIAVKEFSLESGLHNYIDVRFRR